MDIPFTNHDLGTIRACLEISFAADASWLRTARHMSAEDKAIVEKTLEAKRSIIAKFEEQDRKFYAERGMSNPRMSIAS